MPVVRRIPVTYLCWNCGSQVTKIEETPLHLPSKEVWNVCPDCMEYCRCYHSTAIKEDNGIICANCRRPIWLGGK